MARKKKPTRTKRNTKNCPQKRKRISRKNQNHSKPKKFIYDPKNVTKFRCPVKCYEICHDKFLTYEEITKYLNSMVKKYPERLQLEIIGKSLEEKPIYLVVIFDDSYDQEKMSTLIEAGSDGSDRLAIASALYLVDFITKNKSLAKIMNYMIIPCSNPDAYDKNINNRKDDSLNLTNNFPILLGANCMDDISTEEFLKAIGKWKTNLRFGAPTTKAIYTAIHCNQLSIKLFVSLQENGKSLAYPFGFCTEQIFDEAEIENVALSAQAVMKRIQLDVGPLCDVSGILFGSVIDFLKFQYKQIKFTYIFNIKDKEKVSKTGDILVYGEDVLRCIKSLARNVFMSYNSLGSKNKCN